VVGMYALAAGFLGFFNIERLRMGMRWMEIELELMVFGDCDCGNFVM